MPALWAIAVGVVAGCGDNTVGRECGPGTHDDGNGVCVPDGTTNCGPGTVEMNGECVPDGSVICGDGTVFNPATGVCDPDPSVCAPGTVLVNGMCVDPGVIAADAEEAAEPNDGNGPGEIAGQITVNGIGQPGFVIHGCVNPYTDADGNGNPDPDNDLWIIDAPGPMALDITADGVGGLAAAFAMIAGDQELIDAGWQRIGINLVDDKSERQLYLPKAGLYGLSMTDSRSLFLGEGAGNADACYYATIEQIALPAATPGTVTDTPGQDDRTLRVISFDPGDGDLFDNLLDDAGSNPLAPGIVILKNGAYLASAVETSDPFFGTIPAQTFAGGLAAGDTFEVVVDSLYNFALNPVDYTLVTTQFLGQALPTDGSTITVTPQVPYFNFLYFDVDTAGEIENFNVTFGRALDYVRVADANLNVIARLADAGSFPAIPPIASIDNEFFRFLEPGRYYLLTADSAATPADTYQVTGTLVAQVPSPIAIGTPVTGAGLPATGSAFYTFDFGTNLWDDITASATNGGVEITASPYVLSGAGWLDNGYNAVGTFTFDAAGGDVFEHIFVGDPNDYLIRVQTSAPTPTTTYDLAINSVSYVDLGTLVAGTPLDRAGDAFAASTFQRYIATAAAGSIATITASPNTASPNIDIIMETLPDTFLTAPLLRNVSPYIIRADVGFDGDPETLASGATPYIAFAVGDYFGAAGTVDLHIDTESPQPYDIVPGALGFTSVCASQGGSGTNLTLTDDGSGFGPADEGLTGTEPLPFAFNLFGEPVTDYIASSNGWISLAPTTVTAGTGNGTTGAMFVTQAFPTTGFTEGLFGPYWHDLNYIEICQLETASSVTLEWRGETYTGGPPGSGDPMEFQLVIHDDHSVDIIYGSTHSSTGNASIGAENTGGGFGQQITDDVLASTSLTLTPIP
jgi:hypothetical protein